MVYLRDSAFYLLTEQVTKWQRTKAEYTEITYAQP